MGLGPVLGRGFSSGEDQPGKEQVVVLSHRTWQSRFGGDARILGHSITLNEKSYAVIGVLRAGSVFDRGWAEIWLPLAFQPHDMTRNFHWFGAIARLKPGVTIEKARAEMDSMARVAASLRNRTAPANVIIQRLANSSSSDRLGRALTALGRIIKTIFILRYIDDEKMRDTVQLQLNHGEHRHDLTRRCLFFANRGEFRTGDLDEIMNKASCPSLLSNAVLVWNTVHIGEIVARLRASREEIPDADLARISPLCRAHIIPTGIYSFDPEMPGVDVAHNTLQ